MKTNIILEGDSLTQLKTLPDKSINMCMTSPPYWALRDYGVEGQLGLESTFEEYINNLCDIFDEVKRVLREDGTCWVNLGDTYMGNSSYSEKGRQGFGNDKIGMMNKWKDPKNPASLRAREHVVNTLPPKSLSMIPFRFALEMVNRGWILRNTIIWHKPNAMPSSVKDRFTVDFEYIFFFSKKKKYYFETQYEPHKSKVGKPRDKNNEKYKDMDGQFSKGERTFYGEKGRNKRTTWKICPKPFSEAHFAVYPEELCHTPIKAGCPVGGIVLDPFFGAGTTGLVALKQSKNFVGIELNPEYLKIAEKRLKPFLEQYTL